MRVMGVCVVSTEIQNSAASCSRFCSSPLCVNMMAGPKCVPTSSRLFESAFIKTGEHLFNSLKSRPIPDWPALCKRQGDAASSTHSSSSNHKAKCHICFLGTFPVAILH